MKQITYICDNCGKLFAVPPEQPPMSLTYTFGYGSAYDGEQLEADFCPDCAEKIAKAIFLLREKTERRNVPLP